MLFFPPFLNGTLFLYPEIRVSLYSFSSFCLISSCSYIINDICDCKSDQHHPDKCFRPIASGAVSVAKASMVAVILFVLSIIASLSISTGFTRALLSYFFISIIYSVKLKTVKIIDILCISSGFVLRLAAGGIAFCLEIPFLLYACVFLLSIFLSAGKRFSELHRLGNTAYDHRRVLLSYRDVFLSRIMISTGILVLLIYGLYIFKFQFGIQLWSFPLCAVGLVRYVVRVNSGRSGDPTESLVSDIPLLLIGAIWAGIFGWGLYG